MPDRFRGPRDSDALHAFADDQVLLVYSADPGGPDADAPAPLRVVGTRELRTGS